MVWVNYSKNFVLSLEANFESKMYEINLTFTKAEFTWYLTRL